MKILVISNLYPPFQLGGYEIGCRNIVRGLRSLGHEVEVLTSPSHFMGSPGESSPRRLLQLRAFQPGRYANAHQRFEATVSNYTNTSITLSLLEEFRPDCVYLFNLYGIGGLAIIDALNTLRYPWVMHLMDRLPYVLQQGNSNPILGLFDALDGNTYRKGRLISMSRHLLDEIRQSCRLNRTFDADIVPGWADIDGPLIERSYRETGVVRFVTAGAIQTHKGIDLIVEAAALLKKDQIDFEIDIYGYGRQAHFIDLSKEHQVSDKIRFGTMQSQESLASIYRSSDVFLFPTWEREPFGFAPLEAAAVGCVPIITGSCGVSERLVNNVHCLKITRNAKALYKAMKAVCEGKVHLEEIGRNAQTITRQDLSFKECLRQIATILEDVVSSSSGKKIPDTKSHNLCYLKHNLASRMVEEKISS